MTKKESKGAWKPIIYPVLMLLSGLTFLFTILAMILMITLKPSLKIGKLSFQTFWVVTLIGAIVVLATGQVDFSSLWSSLTSGEMNPLKILALFLSLSLISISLDELGFFHYLSSRALERSKGSQYKIFFTLYGLVSLLTIFTSNDIVILTFTPFIILFSKKAKINPLPYLIAEFVNANTYSMLLSIGNPTNIYLSASEGITFLAYLSKMWLPTLLGGLSTLGVILLLFHKDLSKPIEEVEMKEEKLPNKPLIIINLVALGLALASLIVANYVPIESYLVMLGLALSLFVCISILSRSKSYVLDVAKRLPYNLIPFVLSMFLLVFSLKENGIVAYLQQALDALAVNPWAEGYAYALSSTLFDNLINNIPMSILYSSILEGKSELAIYATILGSNIGAYLTPIGALAGIMWMSILKKHQVDFSFLSFMKYGAILVPVALVFSTLGLIALC